MSRELSSPQIDEVAVAHQGGIIDAMVMRARARMHDTFISSVKPKIYESILDIGASATPALASSNYLEWKNPGLSITALGLGNDNEAWRARYPGVPYIHGTATRLPFADSSFDIVYSHAVIEHVGGRDAQDKMIAEALRVARRAVWITTPNRWHPMEFHTALPLLHWLPNGLHRSLLRSFGYGYFSTETTLNLLDRRSLFEAFERSICIVPKQVRSVQIISSKFVGLTANLLLWADIFESR